MGVLPLLAVLDEPRFQKLRLGEPDEPRFQKPFGVLDEPRFQTPPLAAPDEPRFQSPPFEVTEGLGFHALLFRANATWVRAAGKGCPSNAKATNSATRNLIIDPLASSVPSNMIISA